MRPRGATDERLPDDKKYSVDLKGFALTDGLSHLPNPVIVDKGSRRLSYLFGNFFSHGCTGGRKRTELGTGRDGWGAVVANSIKADNGSDYGGEPVLCADYVIHRGSEQRPYSENLPIQAPYR